MPDAEGEKNIKNNQEKSSFKMSLQIKIPEYVKRKTANNVSLKATNSLTVHMKMS